MLKAIAVVVGSYLLSVVLALANGPVALAPIPEPLRFARTASRRRKPDMP
jgi:hypothetical protein